MWSSFLVYLLWSSLIRCLRAWLGFLFFSSASPSGSDCCSWQSFGSKPELELYLIHFRLGVPLSLLNSVPG